MSAEWGSSSQSAHASKFKITPAQFCGWFWSSPSHRIGCQQKKICSSVSIGPLVSSCFCRQQSFQVVRQRVVRQILVVRFPDVSLQLSSTPWWCVVGDTTPCHASFRALQGNSFECFCVHFRGVAMICDDV